MKAIVEKVLKSGIVDRGMVEMLEKWGNLPEGSTELLKNETLKNATRESLNKFAEELADEIATAHILRETNLDLDKLKWPTEVTIWGQGAGAWEHLVGPEHTVYHIPAMADRMGRLYFRFQDIDEAWFVPGYKLSRKVFDKTKELTIEETETILQADPLFVNDEKVAYQVTTTK